jgi:hypothetical protein
MEAEVRMFFPMAAADDGAAGFDLEGPVEVALFCDRNGNWVPCEAPDVEGEGGMSGHSLWNLTRMCQRCAADMPARSVRTFVDDGANYYLCRDTEACDARLEVTVQARQHGGGLSPTSYLVGVVNRLAARVEELEAWRRRFDDPTSGESS